MVALPSQQRIQATRARAAEYAGLLTTASQHELPVPRILFDTVLGRRNIALLEPSPEAAHDSSTSKLKRTRLCAPFSLYIGIRDHASMRSASEADLHEWHEGSTSGKLKREMPLL